MALKPIESCSRLVRECFDNRAGSMRVVRRVLCFGGCSNDSPTKLGNVLRCSRLIRVGRACSNLFECGRVCSGVRARMCECQMMLEGKGGMHG
jgi:hypothetical protein